MTFNSNPIDSSFDESMQNSNGPELVMNLENKTAFSLSGSPSLSNIEVLGKNNELLVTAENSLVASRQMVQSPLETKHESSFLLERRELGSQKNMAEQNSMEGIIGSPAAQRSEYSAPAKCASGESQVLQVPEKSDFMLPRVDSKQSVDSFTAELDASTCDDARVSVDAGDESMATFVSPEPKTRKQREQLSFHSLTWSAAAQEGYRISPDKNRTRSKLHDGIEDMHYPTLPNDVEAYSVDAETLDFPKISESQVTSKGAKVFVLADGHGGPDAAKFFVPRIARDVLELLESREWDLAELQHRSDISMGIMTIFRIADAEYAATKVAQYQRWMEAGGISSERPTDDGCTMVVNIVDSEWIVNCNVGDSRTVIGAKLPSISREPTSDSEDDDEATLSDSNEEVTGKFSGWIQLFASSDHNMMHPEKISHIHQNGGRFIDPTGTSFVPIAPQPFHERGMKPYVELSGTRLMRPFTQSIKAVGCSHRRTLNLTGTMGDLLFKIEPAILTPIPDIRFIKLEPGMDYVLVAATDGVWDHLRIQYPESVQSDQILSFVTQSIEETLRNNPKADNSNPNPSVSPEEPQRQSHDSDSTQANSVSLIPHRQMLQDELSLCAQRLVHRENDMHSAHLFTPNLQRYDDATAMVLYFSQK